MAKVTLLTGKEDLAYKQASEFKNGDICAGKGTGFFIVGYKPLNLNSAGSKYQLNTSLKCFISLRNGETQRLDTVARKLLPEECIKLSNEE